MNRAVADTVNEATTTIDTLANVQIGSLALIALIVLILAIPKVLELLSKRSSRTSDRPPAPAPDGANEITGRFLLEQVADDTKAIGAAVGLRPGRPSLLEELLERLVASDEKKTLILKEMQKEQREQRILITRIAKDRGISTETR